VVKRQRTRRETFAEVLRDTEPATPPPVQVPYFPWRTAREYTDAAGIVWRRRGRPPRWSRVRQLLLDPDVRVAHAYLQDVRNVPPAERDPFLAKVRPYLTGSREPAPGDHTGYFAYEYKDDTGRTLLVIEETC
jgi:hypothetical protein